MWWNLLRMVSLSFKWGPEASQNPYSCNFQIAPSHFWMVNQHVLNKNTIFPYPAMKIDLSFEVVVKGLSFLLVIGWKSQVFLSSEEGQRTRWIAGLWGRSLDWRVNGWQMFTEARLPLRLEVGRRTLPLPPQIPAHSISTARNMWWILSFTLAKTMGFPVSNFYPNQMAWMFHTRGPGQVWASSTTHSVHFYLRVKGFSDCHPFIAAGFRGAPRVTSDLVQIVSKLLF